MVKSLIVSGGAFVPMLKRSSVKLMIWYSPRSDQLWPQQTGSGTLDIDINYKRFKLYVGTPFMSVWPPYAQPLPWLQSQFNKSGSQSLDGNVDRKTLTKMFKSPRSPSSARRSSSWCSAATPPGPRGRQTCRRQHQQPEQSFDFSQNRKIFLTCPIVWPMRGGLPGPQT